MRRFVLGAFVLGGLAAGAATAAAAEQERCSALPTAAERIVCYDRQFPPDHPSQPASAPAANAPAANAPAPGATIATPPPAAPPVATSTPVTPPARETEEQRSWVRGLFDSPERVQLAGTIKALRRGDSRNTIYVLDNDQLWLQDSARQLPFRVGDAVTIENGTFGGYFMTSDSGTKTRVRRIK